MGLQKHLRDMFRMGFRAYAERNSCDCLGSEAVPSLSAPRHLTERENQFAAARETWFVGAEERIVVTVL